MNQTVDLDYTKLKITEKLHRGNWHKILEPFVQSREMEVLLMSLFEDNSQGYRMNPGLKLAFRAFEECPWEGLRVVIVGQEPFTELGSSDGLAFSGSHRDPDGKMPVQARLVLKEVAKTCHSHLTDFEYAGDPDLKRWANQGVLLLNSALTSRVDTRGAHLAIWEPFTRFVIKQICTYHFGVVFAFVGKRARSFSSMVSDQQIKLFCEHPSVAITEKRYHWNSENLFNKANETLFGQNGTEIHW